MHRRTIAAIGIVPLLLFATACGNPTNTPNTAAPKTETQTETETEKKPAPEPKKETPPRNPQSRWNQPQTRP